MVNWSLTLKADQLKSNFLFKNQLLGVLILIPWDLAEKVLKESDTRIRLEQDFGVK